MSWGFVAVAGATVVSGALGANAARRAGRAGQQSADAATAESARQYDQTRQDFAPWRTTGAGAINQLGRLFGLPTASAPLLEMRNGVPIANEQLYASNPEYRQRWDQLLSQHQSQFGGGYTADSDVNWIEGALRDTVPVEQQSGPDMSAFFQSPGYQFRRDEGTRGLERTAAARGGAFSGNALRALAEFNSGLASQEFGNYFNQLSNIAGLGQTATNATAAYGADHAANAGRNALYAGDSRASGIIGQANAYGNALQGLGGLYGYYSMNKRPVGNG